MVKLVQIRPVAAELYLDCNATTPVLPEIVQAVAHVMGDIFGNPSSSHITGLKARYILDTTRRLARQIIGVQDGDVLFTSGATEGIQTAVLSSLHRAICCPPENQPKNPRWLLYGATEHKAVPQALEHWNRVLRLGAELKAIPVDTKGLLDHDFIKAHAADAAMICTMAVNNETGVQQDLVALEQTIRGVNPTIPWLVDGVQALGKLDLQLARLSIDYVAFSGHKLYAPKGIGFMYVRKGAPFTPLMIGGGQESGLRSGTENLPGIAALHALFEMLLADSPRFSSHAQLHGYREQLAEALQAAFPTLVFNNDFDVSVATTLNFSVKGVSSRDIMDVFDAANIRVSSGSACSSKVTGSYVLDAMGLEHWRSQSAIRLSFGPATSAADIAAACSRIRRAAQALQQSCLLPTDVNSDSDSDLNGIVQWRYDDHCCYLIIDKAARQLIIIDPVAPLAERLENLVQCRGYKVQAIVTSQPQDQEATGPMLAQLLCASGCDEARDHYGWPQSATVVDGLSQVQIGDRTLYRIGQGNPAFVLSARGESARIEFTFGNTNTAVAAQSSLNQLELSQSVVCPPIDAHYALALRWCEVIGECVQRNDLDLGLDDERSVLQQPQTLVIDVRERQEHLMQPLPVAAEVLNVPLTRAAQFIVDQRAQLKDRTVICVCRSGHRSAAVAQALVRHGFTKVRHLTGGLALLHEELA